MTTGELFTSLPDCTITPRDYQLEAATKLLLHFTQNSPHGILKLPCGAGKTKTSLYFMWKWGYQTAIVVPTEQLLWQWVEDIQEAFPGVDVGVYFGKKKSLEQEIVVMTIQSALKLQREQLAKFGLVIFDEVHSEGAEEWSNVVELFTGKARLGLSATPERSDQMHKLIYASIGPVVVDIPAKYLEDRGYILKPKVYIFPFPHDGTCWRRKWNADLGYPELVYDYPNTCTSLAENEQRNQLIDRIIGTNMGKGRATLAITNRLSQIARFVEKHACFDPGVIKAKVKNFAKILLKKFIVGISSLVKQGLDKRDLATVIMCIPVSDAAMLEQIKGRLNRPASDLGKGDPVIVDIVDTEKDIFKLISQDRHYDELTPLEASFKARVREYRRMGMELFVCINGQFYKVK